jgi:hypothetical protein
MDDEEFSTSYILSGIAILAYVTTGPWAGIVVGFPAGTRTFFFSLKCPDGL